MGCPLCDAMMEILLRVEHLKMHFPVRGGIFRRRIGWVHAVDDVSFDVPAGETLGLVGESGCGKTTVGRTILRLYEPSGGRVFFGDQDLSRLGKAELRSLRQDMQMIFQDPYESLNSRHTIGAIVEDPFIIHGIGSPEERRKRVLELLDRVGISSRAISRFPHEFSGGQRQRIGIARAIALNPKLIICDEPVSALDVSIQSQIINLLLDLQNELGLTYLFIAHDLAVVKHISDRVAVMYLGKIMEYADAESLYTNPAHPYTAALIAAIPIPDPAIQRTKHLLKGDVPSPINPPSGCVFHTRCPFADAECQQTIPKLTPASGNRSSDHLVACLKADRLTL